MADAETAAVAAELDAGPVLGEARAETGAETGAAGISTPWMVSIAAISAGALLLRIVSIGSQSLWSDEVEVIRRAGLSFKGILADTARHAPLDGPLSYVITHAMLVVSRDEGWLRYQSTIWSIVALAGILALALRLFELPRVALIAAFLLAVAPFELRYADELRYYTAAAALQLWSFYFFVGWLRKPGRLQLAGYLVSTVALIGMATIYGVLVLGIQGVAGIAIAVRERKRLSRFAPYLAPILAGFLVLPWILLAAVLRLKTGGPLGIREDVVFVWTADLPLRAAAWLLSNAEPITPLATTLLAMAAVGVAAGFITGNRSAMWLVLLVAVELGFLAIGAAALGTNVAFRRTLLILPPLLLASAAGLDALIQAFTDYVRPPDRKLIGNALTVGALAIIGILSIRPIIATLSSEKPDYRDAIATAARDPHRPLVIIGPAEEPLDRAVEYYARREGVDTVRYQELTAALSRNQYPTGWNPGRPVMWLTTTPVGANGYRETAYNDLNRLATLAGDEGYPRFALAAFAGTFQFPPLSVCELRQEAETVGDATASTSFPALRVWRNDALAGLKKLDASSSVCPL
jgi:hypothetical protein